MVLHVCVPHAACPPAFADAVQVAITLPHSSAALHSPRLRLRLFRVQIAESAFRLSLQAASAVPRRKEMIPRR
jgi:hypothetical protein